MAIIGAGLAGLRAAVAAADFDSKLDIAVISKHHPLRSHSVCAQGGTGAVMREKDSFDLHAYDTVKGADFLADQDVAEFFVKRAPREIVLTEHWGAPGVGLRMEKSIREPSEVTPFHAHASQLT